MSLACVPARCSSPLRSHPCSPVLIRDTSSRPAPRVPSCQLPPATALLKVIACLGSCCHRPNSTTAPPALSRPPCAWCCSPPFLLSQLCNEGDPPLPAAFTGKWAISEQRQVFISQTLSLYHGRTLALSPSETGVECIIFNEEYMTCMWNSQGKPAVNYSLYYWYNNDKSSAVECRRYLQEGGINNGCWFSSTELIKYCIFEILLNGSLGAEKVIPFTQDMRLQNRVKLNPPVNLTIVSMNNNQLLLTWESSYRKDCVEFKVKYTNNKETTYTEIRVNKQFQFSHPSVDPEKFYTFYVSAKVSDMCATTDLWSEWSLPIYWGKNTTRVADPPCALVEKHKILYTDIDVSEETYHTLDLQEVVADTPDMQDNNLPMAVDTERVEVLSSHLPPLSISMPDTTALSGTPEPNNMDTFRGF